MTESHPNITYRLPPARVALGPSDPREDAKLFTYRREDGAMGHKAVRDLPDLIRAGDMVVVNAASVRRALLAGRSARGGEKREILLLRQERSRRGTSVWEVMMSEGTRPGDRILLPRDVVANVQYSVSRSSRRWRVQFSLPPGKFSRYMEAEGAPLPRAAYDTAFADPNERRSVLAPDAGLHLTVDLASRLRDRGAEIEPVVLDVGIGGHTKEPERVKISEQAAFRINAARQERRRVVAIGLSVVRALESAADSRGTVYPFDDETSLRIAPGYPFRAVDVLLTNFHAPRSPLLTIVAAFIGVENEVHTAYQEAIDNTYRFTSFGDAMLIE